MSGHWSQQRERGSLFAMRLLMGFAALFGRRLSRLWLYPICLYFVLFARDATRASREYLTRVFGRSPTWREIYRHFFTFASVLLDRGLYHSGHPVSLDVNCVNQEVMIDLDQQRRGALLLGAHFGGFDLNYAMGNAGVRARISLMMYEENARKIQTMFENMGGRREMQVIPIGQINTLLRAKDEVDAGHWVGVMADRAFSDERQIRVPFLGGMASFPAGPFLAASVLKVPVVLYVCVYLGGNHYQEHFELLAEEITLGRRNRDIELEQWVQRYAQRLEHYCRQHPYNWFNFYDFWSASIETVAEASPAVATRNAA